MALSNSKSQIQMENGGQIKLINLTASDSGRHRVLNVPFGSRRGRLGRNGQCVPLRSLPLDTKSSFALFWSHEYQHDPCVDRYKLLLLFESRGGGGFHPTGDHFSLLHLITFPLELVAKLLQSFTSYEL